MHPKDEVDSANTPAVSRVLRIVGGLSLLLAPLGVTVGWALNYGSVGAFLTFDFSSPYVGSGKSSSAEQFLSTSTGPDGGFRYLVLPHYFVYAAMPVFIAASLCLARVLFRTAPWRAAIGSALTSLGAVYFVGVLGAWLSFPAVASVPSGGGGDLLPVVRALTTVQGALLVSTGLSVLVFVGMIVLGFGLYRSRIVPRWSAILVIAGNVLILAFAGTENWMVLGSLSMLVGLLPLSRKMLRGNATNGVSTSEKEDVRL